MSLSFLTVEKAVAEMPLCLVSSYDPTFHKTLSDLQSLGNFEVDCYADEDESAIESEQDHLAVLRWLEKLRC